MVTVDWSTVAILTSLIGAPIGTFVAVALWVGKLSGRVDNHDRVLNDDRRLFTNLDEAECALREHIAAIDAQVSMLKDGFRK